MVLLIGQPAGYTGNNETVATLNSVIDKELPKGTDQDRAKLYKRTRLVVQEVMASEFLKEKAAITKFAMAVYHLLDNLLEQGLFPVEEGSPLEDSFELILQRLSDFTGVTMNKFDQEAFEAAQRMFDRLKQDGYYAGVQWITVFKPAGEANGTVAPQETSPDQ